MPPTYANKLLAAAAALAPEPSLAVPRAARVAVTVWHAETPCHTRAVSDNARRNATSAVDDAAHAHRAAERERIAGLDAFELIREQAQAALNAIGSRCREDHNRIISSWGTADVTPPTSTNKLLAAAAALAPEPSLAEAMQGPDAQVQVSPAFVEATSEAVSETAWSDDCADEWVAAAADEQDFASVAALNKNPADEPTESAEVEAPPIVAVDLNEGRPSSEIGENPTEYSDKPLEEIQPFARRRHQGRARHWSPPRWPMSRLQTGILALLVVDCILVGWRGDVVRALPQTSSFYKLVGLPVNLRGLRFDGITTTTEQHRGVLVLAVEGNIVNDARTFVDVPQLKFVVRNAARQEIYSWTAVPSRTLLPPGEAVSFRTRLASPPPDAHDVLLRFVDRRRDIVAAR